MMFFRWFVVLAGCLMLAGCGGESVTKRFRVIATAEVDGEIVEGSTVMEVTYTRVTKSLMGAGGAVDLKGEALILDLKDKGTVYILPWEHYAPNVHGSIKDIYEYLVPASLGIKNSFGTFSDQDYEVLRSASGRHKFKQLKDDDGRIRRPLMISFASDGEPGTIYEVEPESLNDYFSGARFIDLEFEFTDTPVTDRLSERLPWLANQAVRDLFPRDPPGKQRAEREKPLAYKIARTHFFALGSQR